MIKKLLLLLLVPMLSTVFVTVDRFNELEAQVNQLEERVAYLESLIEIEEVDELLTQTFYAESKYYTAEFVVIDGVATEMTICALFDNECQTGKQGEEQPRLYTNIDIDGITSDLQSYIELLDRVYEKFN